MNSLRAVFQKRCGTAEWDAVLRATGLVALLALYPSYRWPWIAGLVGFFCLTLFVSSPISVVLPAAFEPMLMVAGRAYSPLLVTLVAVIGVLYMDYVNYYVFGAAIEHPRLATAKNSRLVQRTLALFDRSPFFAVWLCAWSPIPYWIVSILAPLSRYPMAKYLLATALGRAPRIWFFAALGLLIPLSTQSLVTFVVSAIALGIAVVVWKRRAAHRQQGEQPCGSSLLSFASATRQLRFESR
jgi:uncharacterized membrane protein YdjX (TVP38/TMEM64 family)